MITQVGTDAGKEHEHHLTVDVGGTGAQVVNVFKVLGTIRIIDQAAEIVEVTTLSNLTNVYASLYDGTNTELLTADGATLSGAPIGTVFTKDKTADQPYSVLLADQCRVSETVSDKRIGLPFTVTQKYGADTFIRFHYTTTDNPVAFKMHVCFRFCALNGGRLLVV